MLFMLIEALVIISADFKEFEMKIEVHGQTNNKHLTISNCFIYAYWKGPKHQKWVANKLCLQSNNEFYMVASASTDVDVLSKMC